MSTIPEELGKALEEAGVPPSAARLFLLVRHEGPLTARELARRAGIHRVEAYRELKALAGRGLVTARGRPQQFETSSLPGVLRSWMGELKVRARELEREGRRWRRRTVRPEAPAPSRVLGEEWIEGRSEIRRFFFRRVAEVRTSLKVGFPSLSALVPAVRGERANLIRAMARGVSIRVLVSEGEGSSRLARALAGTPGMVLRQVKPRFVTSPFALVDREGLLLAVLTSPWVSRGPRQASLWTRSRSVVRSYQTRFDLLFEQGTPVAPRRARRPGREDLSPG